MEGEILSVTELREFVNQTLSYAYPAVVVQGEVSSFKVNQGKWIFFDLKDDETTISCFMTKYQLNTIIEDGMLVRVTANPNLTKWGKFSLTVRSVELAGEGSVKRAFEKLKAQFEAEGLFAPGRKRILPDYPSAIGLITSSEAAAYNDFLTIVQDRWPLMELKHIHVHVQGLQAPGDVVAALSQLNRDYPELDAVVIIRGGGSLEDLQAFNDERVVRAVYASTIPTIVGIGHEDDVSLAELAADVRAATPTDAARRLTPDQHDVIRLLGQHVQQQAALVERMLERTELMIQRTGVLFQRIEERAERALEQLRDRIGRAIDQTLVRYGQRLMVGQTVIHAADPQRLLARGYAIARQDEYILMDPTQVNPQRQIVVQLAKGVLRLRSLEPGAATTTTNADKEAEDEQTQLKLS
ncbi:exodeoxyribonuclease VII large subunit [Patescibacteria group bacterium]|nr:MAG: exodeoxyribonuclease VII large subunit [Patescibacteria group bacterium]